MFAWMRRTVLQGSLDRVVVASFPAILVLLETLLRRQVRGLLANDRSLATYCAKQYKNSLGLPFPL